jgi:hypothetical protein
LTAHRRYLWWLGGGIAMVMLPVLLLNLRLLKLSLGVTDVLQQASDWQQATRGIVNVAGPDRHLFFKTLRLNDRLTDIDTIVLGSSTMMGVSQQSLPASVHAYNFSTDSNPLSAVIAEANYIVEHMPKIRRLIVPVDWAAGFVYLPYQTGAADLTVESARAATAPRKPISTAQRVREAVSYPRIVSLWRLLSSIATSDDPASALAGAFESAVGPPYQCDDGTPARDYDTVRRAVCAGFRYDGSSTFGGVPSRGDPEDILRAGLRSDERYVRQLRHLEGEPDRRTLEQLAELDRRMRASGRQLIVLRPPLFPGLEAGLAQLPLTSDALRRTNVALDRWVSDNGITAINASRSEDFGCVTSEFLDGHHAFRACFAKVFAAAWPAP